jgi:hypothetical protein
MGMTAFASLNLIDLLTWYLVASLLVSTLLRLRNYREMIGLVLAFAKRWPRLLELVKQHRAVFLQWPTIVPLACTAILLLVNSLASLFVWSQAHVSMADLALHGYSCTAVVVTGPAMVVLDVRLVFRVVLFDRAALEADFDRAEHWLGTWKAPALRWLTLGFFDPHRMVQSQVRQALVKANEVVNGQLWLWALQFTLRFAFGLALWMSWFMTLQETAPTALRWR